MKWDVFRGSHGLYGATQVSDRPSGIATEGQLKTPVGAVFYTIRPLSRSFGLGLIHYLHLTKFLILFPEVDSNANLRNGDCISKIYFIDHYPGGLVLIKQSNAIK